MGLISWTNSLHQWGDQSPKFRIWRTSRVFMEKPCEHEFPPKETTWMIEPCWAMLSLSSVTHWIQGFPTEAGGFNKFCWIHRRKALAGWATWQWKKSILNGEILPGSIREHWMMDFPYQIARRLRSDLKTRPGRGWGWTAMEDSINNGTLIRTDKWDISATTVGYTLHLLTYTYIILNANNQ